MKISLQPFIERLMMHIPLSNNDQGLLTRLQMHVEEFPSRKTIVEFRRSSDWVYLVLDGIVGSFRENRQGLRQLVSLHLRGDAANLNLVGGPAVDSGIESLSDARVAVIPLASLRELAAERPAIRAAF